MFHCFAEKSCQTSPIASTGNQHRTTWLSGTWRPWTEMFILRMFGYKWRPNYGVRSIIATGHQSRYCFLFCFVRLLVSCWTPPPPFRKQAGVFVSSRYRLTLCRCVLWKYLHAQGNRFSTWSITSKASTSSTTRTLASWGTTTYVLHLRYNVSSRTKYSCHRKWSVIHTSHEPVFTQQFCGLRLSVTLRLSAQDTSW